VEFVHARLVIHRCVGEKVDFCAWDARHIVDIYAEGNGERQEPGGTPIFIG